MHHTLQQRVFADVDQDAMVELASALIRTPSFKTKETSVAGLLADFFRPHADRLTDGYGDGTFARSYALREKEA